jgi:hypothetical protein
MTDAVHATTVSMGPNRIPPHERSLSAIVADIKQDLAEFVSTRVRILKAESQETLGALKFGIPMGALGIAFFATAGLLFTAAAVVLVASAFAGNPYAWFFAFVIIGFLWVIFGATAAFFAVYQFRSRFPKRTLQVLKADKLWLQNEARSRL